MTEYCCADIVWSCADVCHVSRPLAVPGPLLATFARLRVRIVAEVNELEGCNDWTHAQAQERGCDIR
jgi:hypothetical protein